MNSLIQVDNVYLGQLETAALCCKKIFDVRYNDLFGCSCCLSLKNILNLFMFK